MSLKIGASISPEDKHDYDVTALIFVKGKLYSASDDGKIKVWTPDLKLLHQIVAHPCSIYSLTTDGANIIYSCSNDGTVRAWSLEKLEDKGTVCTSEREFWKLFWNMGTLYIVNDQGTISIFKNGKACAQIQTLEQIKDFAVSDRLIFTVRDLDMVIAEQSGDKGRTITCKTYCGRAPLCLVGNMLCYSSRDGKDIIVTYNNKENKFKHITEIKDVHDKLINALAGVVVDGTTHLYCGGWDNVVKQYQLKESGYTAGAICPLPTYVNVLNITEDGKTIYAAGGEGNIWRLDYTA